MNYDASNNAVLSGSAAIKAYLQQKGVGWKFTAASLKEDLPNVSDGSVSGFLAKIKSSGHIESYGTNLGAACYRVLKELDDVIVKPRGTIAAKAEFGLPDVVSRLTEALGILETYKSPLNKFSDTELLAELNRRATERAKLETPNG